MKRWWICVFTRQVCRTRKYRSHCACLTDFICVNICHFIPGNWNHHLITDLWWNNHLPCRDWESSHWNQKKNNGCLEFQHKKLTIPFMFFHGFHHFPYASGCSLNDCDPQPITNRSTSLEMAIAASLQPQTLIELPLIRKKETTIKKDMHMGVS